jgi:hypothetical protein
MDEKEEHKNSGERSAEDIRNDIAARRESITQTVGRLGDRIHETLDWRGHISRHPYASLGIAVGAGLIVGGMFKRKSSPSERLVEALTDKVGQLGEELRDSARKILVRTVAPSLFKGTIYGFAGKALMQYLQNRAAHFEGNGSNFHGSEWNVSRPSASTPTIS